MAPLQAWGAAPFILDAAQPVANGMPHFSNGAAGHLYVGRDGRGWKLDDEFCPDQGTTRAVAWFEVKGGVPAGEQTWDYMCEGKHESRTLTVTEVSATQLLVNEHLRVGALMEGREASAMQAERAVLHVKCGYPEFSPEYNMSREDWERQSSCDLSGPFTLDLERPNANGRPHYANASGCHIYYARQHKWVLSDRFLPGTLSDYCIFMCVTYGQVPTGTEAWWCYVGTDVPVTVEEVALEA